MTKKDTTERLYDLLINPYLSEKDYDAIWVMLNLSDAIDKIKAEIENHCGLLKENHCKYCSYCNSVIGVREILEIIDKHKAESEE